MMGQGVQNGQTEVMQEKPHVCKKHACKKGGAESFIKKQGTNFTHSLLNKSYFPHSLLDKIGFPIKNLLFNIKQRCQNLNEMLNYTQHMIQMLVLIQTIRII
jgi:hypothetical protein